MRDRTKARYRPRLEPLEPRRPLSAGASGAAHLAPPPAGPGAIRPDAVNTGIGYLVYRVTNPTGGPVYKLTPPFEHVLVQARQPVPGQYYNILMVVLKNNTKQTFDASSGFYVRLPYQQYFPILTGDQKWLPGQNFIFYALTKQYYPLANRVTSGFQFKLAGGWSTAIPGPSGIFLRIKYNPATIDKILDYAATQGPGAQGGSGIPFGLPDTAIYAFVPAKQRRKDFGGYF
jgi:hypothetical protein